MTDTKRRLPILQPNDGEGDEARPRFQWVGFGALLVFVGWLPLAYLAEVAKAAYFRAITGATSGDDTVLALASLPATESAKLRVVVVLSGVIPLSLGALAAGYIVARYARIRTAAARGSRPGTRPDAALAGLVATVVAAGGSAIRDGFAWPMLLPVALGVAFATLGGTLALRGRPPAG